MYKPIQIINVNGLNKNIIYKEYFPQDNLSDYVSCYWMIKSKEKLITGVEHRILPDGCVDIIFDLENKNTFISGIMNKTENMILRNKIDFMGIRFLPKAVPFIMKGEAKYFVNELIQAKELCKELNELYNIVLEADN